MINFSFIFLTSCAPSQKPDATLTTHAPPAQTFITQSKASTVRLAQNMTSWTITGAVAAKNKNDAWSASLNWQQDGPNNYHIRLFGPLGGGNILIEKKGAMVTYQDAQNRKTSRSADDLIHLQTGMHIPIQNLYYWIRGLPAPGVVQSTNYDHAGNLTYLEQAGYTIQYMRYTNTQGVNLPSKLHVRGAEGSLKLIIKRWKTH